MHLNHLPKARCTSSRQPTACAVTTARSAIQKGGLGPPKSMLATHIFQGPMWTRTSYLEREKQPGRVTNVQCKVRTSERTRRLVAKRGRTTSKAPESARRTSLWRDGTEEPIDSLAERGKAAQKGAVRHEKAYWSHWRPARDFGNECIAPCGARGNMRPPCPHEAT